MPLPPENEKKFWRTPELVDRLMTFLDGHSTLSLVKALPLAFDMIEGKSSWIKLVRRVCPYVEDGVVSCEEWKEQVAKERKDVRSLVEILKMMKDPSPPLLDLLHVICERFPPDDRDEVLADAHVLVQAE